MKSLEPEWESVSDSERISAYCYFDGKILVKFPDGTVWFYTAEMSDWKDFQGASSKGLYLFDVLNKLENGAWNGN